jgi:thiamine biosynthesis lipoprotein
MSQDSFWSRLAGLFYWMFAGLSGFCLSLLAGCSDPGIHKLQGSAQGTTYHISYWSEQKLDHEALKKALATEFARLDQLLSNYRPDSMIELFNAVQETENLTVSPEIVALVRVAEKVHQASQGCYDLTIKPLFELWGFATDNPHIPEKPAIATQLAQIGMEKLRIIDDSHLTKQQVGLKVDLSSVAQGYSVEKISQVLAQQGVVNYLVEIGGELKTQGQKPDGQAWRIALERPLPGQQTLHKVLSMPKDRPMAVMTSGTYRHFFDENGKRYSHILDARTGWPISHDLVSVTVVYSDPLWADAWSTALLCLGQQDGITMANKESVAALFIQQQGDKLVESRSDALNALTALTIH